MGILLVACVIFGNQPRICGKIFCVKFLKKLETQLCKCNCVTHIYEMILVLQLNNLEFLEFFFKVDFPKQTYVLFGPVAELLVICYFIFTFALVFFILPCRNWINILKNHKQPALSTKSLITQTVQWETNLKTYLHKYS